MAYFEVEYEKEPNILAYPKPRNHLGVLEPHPAKSRVCKLGLSGGPELFLENRFNHSDLRVQKLDLRLFPHLLLSHLDVQVPVLHPDPLNLLDQVQLEMLAEVLIEPV